MPRLFVAIDLAPELKQRLASLCTGGRGVRWVATCNFHLTLRFIGQVDDPTAERVAEALARITAPPIRLTLAGAGEFGGRNLWVGVEDNPALLRLQSAIETELQRIGLPADPRSYQPHVKLARSPRRRNFRRFLDDHASFRAEPFEVRTFSLIESFLRQTGAVYEHRADYLLVPDEQAPGPEGSPQGLVSN